MSSEKLLKVRGLKKWFILRKGFGIISTKPRVIRAVDGINLDIYKGEILGIIGESGSGKTTVARCILRLVEPTEGQVLFDGVDVLMAKKQNLRRLRRQMQMIFQNPYESMSDNMKVYDIVAEPTKFHSLAGNTREMVTNALDLVRLAPPTSFLDKVAYELSGGQRQRVAAARAIILSPKLLISDEPTSMIDVSLRIGFLNTLLDLKESRGVSGLFITHDISLARYLCDRIDIMYRGIIVEKGDAEEITRRPFHPYTQVLMNAVRIDGGRGVSHIQDRVLEIDKSSKREIEGCRFIEYCPSAMLKCSESEPQLMNVDDNHLVACFLYGCGTSRSD